MRDPLHLFLLPNIKNTVNKKEAMLVIKNLKIIQPLILYDTKVIFDRKYPMGSISFTLSSLTVTEAVV